MENHINLRSIPFEGIGGLATAISLATWGHRILILESASQVRDNAPSVKQRHRQADSIADYIDSGSRCRNPNCPEHALYSETYVLSHWTLLNSPNTHSAS